MSADRKFGLFWLAVALIAMVFGVSEYLRAEKSFSRGQDSGRCEMVLVVVDSQPDLSKGHEAIVAKCRKIVGNQ